MPSEKELIERLDLIENIALKFIVTREAMLSSSEKMPFDTWKKLVSIYIKSRESGTIAIQTLSELALTIVNTEVIATNGDEHEQVAQVKKKLKSELKEYNMIMNQYDEKGFLKPEFTLNKQERQQQLFTLNPVTELSDIKEENYHR